MSEGKKDMRSGDIKIGDTVEVLHLEQTGLMIREIWRRGNVRHVDADQIDVEFNDGERLMVPKYARGQKWR